MENLTFDEMWEDLKSNGTKKEQQALQTAEDVSNVMLSIISERIEQGLSQKELAERTGLKQSAIARMERLQVMPRVDTVVKVANALGIRIKAIDATQLKREIPITAVYVNVGYKDHKKNDVIRYVNNSESVVFDKKVRV
ncbi:MAG: helix-turn-helix transcriptional regulator [Bacteroidales bacterium]|nr:helix-turn-helix transcriptional regulator [Bacteroidales bacterium]